jgi:hypothetical protein
VKAEKQNKNSSTLFLKDLTVPPPQNAILQAEKYNP